MVQFMIELDELAEVVQRVASARDIGIEDGNIYFCYLDKDNDLKGVAVLLDSDKERLTVIMSMPMPAEHNVATLIPANSWNRLPESHGTFAYQYDHDDDARVSSPTAWRRRTGEH